MPDSPTQRWVIDQMIPADQCWVTDYREGRRIPLPVMGQYLVELERHRNTPLPQWVQRIKDTMERTGCLAVPFWILQGDRGGHKLRYETADRILAQGLTGEGDPPPPGALPYVAFDERVVTGLVRADRFRGYFQSVLAEKDYREAEAEREVRRRIQERIDASLGETLEEILPGLLALDLPRVEHAPDYREAADRYDETGVLEGAHAGNLSTVPVLSNRR